MFKWNIMELSANCKYKVMHHAWWECHAGCIYTTATSVPIARVFCVSPLSVNLKRAEKSANEQCNSSSAHRGCLVTIKRKQLYKKVKEWLQMCVLSISSSEREREKIYTREVHSLGIWSGELHCVARPFFLWKIQVAAAGYCMKGRNYKGTRPLPTMDQAACMGGCSI